MPAKPPILDSRALQDIMEQLKKLAEIDLPEWTPAGGDAGTMLQRIFARLLEIALGRLNKVPEKNLLAFLDTMGVSLLPPSPARVPLTFSLLPGSPATLVPEGTQAGTQPGGQQPAVIFETEDDLTVIPAQLTTGFTMDPVWDRYTEQTTVLGGQSPTGFTPFVGTKRMPHVLYLGDDELLDFGKGTIDINFEQLTPAFPLDKLRDFLTQLKWQYIQKGLLKPVTPIIPITATSLTNSQGAKVGFISSPIIRLPNVDAIDQTVIQGVSTSKEIQKGTSPSRWLQAVLDNPFPDTQVAQNLRIKNLKLKVMNDEPLLPDFALNNTAPLDVTKDFLPFGEIPKVDDAFYIASQEAFSKPKAIVTLEVKVRPSPPPNLVWEYFKDDKWIEFDSNSVLDKTNNFTQSGIFTLLLPDDIISKFRVRILNGRYLGAPYVEIFRLIETRLAEPVNKYANQVIIYNNRLLDVEVGDVLIIENEWAYVTEVAARGEFVLVVTVAPNLRSDHGRETPVEKRITGADYLVANLVQQAQKNDDYLIVNLTNIHAILTGGLTLLLYDTTCYEFIVIENIERLPDGNFKISLASPVQCTSGHSINTQLWIIIPPLIGIVDGSYTDFSRPFFPLSNHPGSGDTFQVELKRNTLVNTINIYVTLVMKELDLQNTWEFLGSNGWQKFNSASLTDGTKAFLIDGNIKLDFPEQPAVVVEFNEQKSCWIRVRNTDVKYGLPIDYIPLDPKDLTKGYTIKPGTGNLSPPIITKLNISYEAERVPTVLTQSGFLYSEQTLANRASESDGFPPFVSVSSVKDLTEKYADAGQSLYLGFDVAFPEQPVALYVVVAPCSFAGSVIKETRSTPMSSTTLLPLQWEYFNGTAWNKLAVFDGTNNLIESGTVKFLTPTDIQPLAKFDLTSRNWIRARLQSQQLAEQQPPENDPFDTQHLAGIYLNTIPAVQAETVLSETLGSSSGLPGQSFRLTRMPVLSGVQIMVQEPEPPLDEERAVIEAESGADAIQERANTVTGETEVLVRWHEVANFLQSGPHSRHYLLDYSTGFLTFGDGKRGMIPPRGTNNITATYLTGGGTADNVPKGAVAQIKSTLPGIAAVTNPIPADGGSHVETVPAVQERGPQTLKHRGRAAAGADFEWLARQAAGARVARTKCLSNVNRDFYFEPGWVTLIIIPQGSEAKLSPGPELIREVEDYLEARAFVGLSQQTPARVNVIGPGYIQVTVVVEVVPRDIDEAEQVKRRAVAALASFLHPLTGGPKGTGWEFGRDVYASEVYQLLEGLPGVNHVKTLKLVPNAAQHRFTVQPAPTAAVDYPEGSTVMTKDRRKVALLAEPVSADQAVERIMVKGFKEGDRITRILDLTVQSADNGTSADAGTITVNNFKDEVGFPQGSLVMTFDGTQRTTLKQGILPQEDLSQIVVEDTDFVKKLESGEAITVFYPFSMTVTLVKLESEKLEQMLDIEPYEAERVFPQGSILATIDNRVRMPLAFAAPETPSQTVTSLRMEDFKMEDSAANNNLVVALRDPDTPQLSVKIQGVLSEDDIVYLDDNFLVYSGKHRVTMVAE